MSYDAPTKDPMTTKFKRHPLSAAMGDIEPDAFIDMQQSIGARGVLEPIVLFEGMVLDGWNRYTTADGLQVECPHTTFHGAYDDAALFVWDKHFARRNWDKGTKALARANWLRLQSGEAPTIKDDAELLDVSERTVEMARTVAKRAVPQVNKAVMDGAMSLAKAEKVSRLSPQQQRRAAAAPPPAPAPRAKPAIKKWKPSAPIKPEAHDELKDALSVLNEEVERLNGRLAVHFMEGTEEEKAAAAELLESRAAENKQLRSELHALQGVHAALMEERNELMSQCTYYRKRLKALGKLDEPATT